MEGEEVREIGREKRKNGMMEKRWMEEEVRRRREEGRGRDGRRRSSKMFV